MINYNIDEVLRNVQKIYTLYQEILTYLVNGKISMLPELSNSIKKNQKIFEQLCEQSISNPEKLIKLNAKYTEKFYLLVNNSVAKFMGYNAQPLFTTSNKDRRFKDSTWNENCFFDFIKQYYLMIADYMYDSIDIFELDESPKKLLRFFTTQFINAISPSNSILYNPEVLKEAMNSNLNNVVIGFENLLNDIKKSGDILNIPTTDKSAFQFAKNIASTPGKVVMQNELMQLICYEPKSETYKIPLFLVPPCINKYYILDLSKENSLVSFLVQNNFQVFIVSWKNPDKSLSHIDFEDYVNKGIIEPCKYITSNFNYDKLNLVGYCIGGTFLAAAISYIANLKLNYVNSATFITTLLDFANAGDLNIFINEETIADIENQMLQVGYFDGRYLSNSFSLLRANDLIWSFFVNNYLLGRTPVALDILYWNADYTNLPLKMHSYYLRNLYLKNLLKVPNALSILDTPIDLTKINYDTYFIAAKEDHITPWVSVYDGVKLINGKKRFVLTEAGHIAGVINPPSENNKYGYKIANEIYDTHQEWLLNSVYKKESWWLDWKKWLVDHSNHITKSLDYQKIEYIENAPGTYVQEKCMNIN